MSVAPLETLLEQLLKAGEQPNKDLLQAIQDQSDAAVPRLIEIVTNSDLIWADSDSPEVWAPTHAMRLLGRLRATAAIEPLLALVEEEEEADWIREELPDVLGQIGPAAVEPLQAFAADRHHDMYARWAACDSLVKIAQSYPQTRLEVIDFLRTLLQAYPDERPEDETVRGFVIGNLLDLEAKEAYPGIEAAFLEGRVDESIVGLDYVQQELDIRGGAKPQEKAEFEIRLKCLTCGFVRPHAVDVVYCDLGTQERRAKGEEIPYSEFIIPQRIVCPRCGAVDRYELSNEAHLTMTAELLKLLARGESTPGLGGGTEHLRLMHFTVQDGREMHPLAALDMYQRRVEAKPDDAKLRLGYGNVLRFLGRWDEAQAQYEQVQKLDPRNADVYFGLAEMAEMQKDPAKELAMYEEYLARVPRRPRGRKDREAWDYARDTVEELRRQQAGTRSPGTSKATRKTEKQARRAQRRPKKRKRSKKRKGK